MKRFILVYNPLSGDTHFRNRLDEVVDYFKQHSAVIIPFRTSVEGGHDYVMLARDVKADGIIVAGGDGTLHEVINVLIRSGIDLPVGVIPSGTCNDFASYLNISSDIAACCRTIINGHTRLIDVGKANDEYFLNVASAGLLTSVAHSVNASLKNTLGKLAYYLKGLGQLPHFRTLPIRIVADDLIIEDEIFLFLVMNIGTAGGFRKIAPWAEVDDGKLDLLVVHKCKITDLMGLFLSIVAGSHITDQHITYLQARELAIETSEEVESDLDGERGPLLPLKISTLPRRVSIFTE